MDHENCRHHFGETGGDLLAQTFHVGYGVSTVIFLGAFLIAVSCQLASKKYVPFLYWFVIVATSISGTPLSDYMDRTLVLSNATGSLIIFSVLLMILTTWPVVEKSESINNVRTARGEIFYWSAILVSNTLGTALGDFRADDSGLGFGGSAYLYQQY